MANEKVYPSWRYHKTLEARIVQDAKEEKKLGPGWADTPAAFENEVVEMKEVKKALTEETK